MHEGLGMAMGRVFLGSRPTPPHPTPNEKGVDPDPIHQTDATRF